MNNLTMVFCQGMFLIGKLDGGKILHPRIYSLVQVGRDQFQHRLSPLPTNPSFVHLPKEFVYWPAGDPEVKELYIKAVTNILTVEPSSPLGRLVI